MCKKTRRTPEETLMIQWLLHLGFSKKLLSDEKIRSNNESFGKRSIDRASEKINTQLAFQKYKWDTNPNTKTPGKIVNSRRNLIEISILGCVLYNLYGEDIYDGISLEQVISAYNIYTNVRNIYTKNSKQISPDTAYWLATKELTSIYATLPYCEKCHIRYYSSIAQTVKNGCPFCKNIGLGDFIDID